MAGRRGEHWDGLGQVLPDSHLHLPAALARPPVGTLLPGSREGRRRARPRPLESSARHEPRRGTHPGPGGFLSPATPAASHFPRPILGPGWGQKLWKLLQLSVGWHLEETGPSRCLPSSRVPGGKRGWDASERQVPSSPRQLLPAQSGWEPAAAGGTQTTPFGQASSGLPPGPRVIYRAEVTCLYRTLAGPRGGAAVRGSRDPCLGLQGQTAAETRALHLGPALAGMFAPRPVGGRRSRPTCLETQCPRRRNRAWPAPFQFP